MNAMKRLGKVRLTLEALEEDGWDDRNLEWCGTGELYGQVGCMCTSWVKKKGKIWGMGIKTKFHFFISGH